MTAALLLTARSVGGELGLPGPDVAQILAATKVSRSAAYARVGPLLELVSTLARPRGRPPTPAPAASSSSSSDTERLTRAVLAYVMRHPGCVHRDHARQQYTDGFRRFVLEQREAYAALDVEVFADAVQVPLGTLKDWLRAPRPAPAAAPSPPVPSSPPTPDVATAHLQTVLDAWDHWHGSFVDFCDHVRVHLRVPFGRALVGHIVAVHRGRRPRPRDGTRADVIAPRGSFVTFFPGAQWVGDGMQVPVVVDDQRIVVNVELDVDAHTGAFVGASVRDTEDAAAVVEAFEDGVTTTSAPPTALLLDNRPSNHTPEVDATLGDTLRLRATPERPQNKAHVEGAFGLFSRALPELAIDTRQGAPAIGRALGRLAVTIWARTMNHRPRTDRGGRSRVELYAEQPSSEQIAHARRELRAIAERHELARRTLEARRRPEVLALLDAHFTRLGLADPERHVRVLIAGYPLAAIVDGLAVFEGKQRAQTLPEGVDARYLLGIVRNVAAQAEAEHTLRAMLALRLDVRDRLLAPLVAAREALCADTNLARVTAACVDRALATPSPLDRLFWLDTLADVLAAHPRDELATRLEAASRRIHATFAVPLRERREAVRCLVDRLVPVA